MELNIFHQIIIMVHKSKKKFQEMGHSKKQFLEPFKKLKIIFFAVVAQTYTTDANKNYVILGNSALVKCEIPSFVADFVSVVSWLDNDGIEYFRSKLGTYSLHHLDDTWDTQAIISRF